MRNLILVIFLVLFFSGCSLFSSNDENSSDIAKDAFFWNKTETLPVSVFRGFSISDNEELYVFGDEAWYKSRNRGASFQKFQNPDSAYFSKILKRGSTYYGLAHYSTSVTQYEKDSTLSGYFFLTSSIFTSEDGNNWQQKTPSFMSWEFSFQNDSLLHVGREYGIRTYNLENDTYRDREFYSSKLGDFANEIFISSDGAVYLGCHDGIYKSDDNGRTWIRSSKGFIHKDDDNVNFFFENQTGEIYSIGTKVYQSKDQGESWDIFNIGFENEYGNFTSFSGNSINMREDGLIYIASYYGFFVSDFENIEQPKAVFEYGDENRTSWDYYDRAYSFKNGDILLLNENQKKILVGEKKTDSEFWQDFQN